MKIEFYNTIISKIDGKLRFTFGILPSLCISENAIWIHWLFWGINFEHK